MLAESLAPQPAEQSTEAAQQSAQATARGGTDEAAEATSQPPEGTGRRALALAAPRAWWLPVTLAAPGTRCLATRPGSIGTGRVATSEQPTEQAAQPAALLRRRAGPRPRMLHQLVDQQRDGRQLHPARQAACQPACQPALGPAGEEIAHPGCLAPVLAGRERGTAGAVAPAGGARRHGEKLAHGHITNRTYTMLDASAPSPSSLSAAQPGAERHRGAPLRASAHLLPLSLAIFLPLALFV